MAENWKIEGTYFEACNCDAACPCVFLSAPSTGECKVVVAWHIEKGSFGEVSLDGLNAVLVAHAPGHMLEVPWKVALYLDERANEVQSQSLTQIFAGQAGGPLAALAEHIGEVLGVTGVAINYKANGKSRSLSISGVTDVEIEAIGGQGGSEVTIENQPLSVSPGYPVVVSMSKKLSYHDHGYDWEISDKTGFYSPFKYSA